MDDDELAQRRRTALFGETELARLTAFQLLQNADLLDDTLLRELCAPEADPRVAEEAALALSKGMDADDLLALFEELEGAALVPLARRLLARAPARALEPVIRRLGPVPDDPGVARALAAAAQQSDDPRARGALVDLALQRLVPVESLRAEERAELVVRAQRGSASVRDRALRLLLARGWSQQGPRALIEAALLDDPGATPRWAVVAGAFLLPREDLPGPARGAVSHALYYALDHRPRFHPPPARWEPGHKKLALRFALERPELHADTLGYLRRCPAPDLSDDADEERGDLWHLCAALEHLARPAVAPHPGVPRFLRARPQAEVSAAVDAVGRTFGDPDRLGGDVEGNLRELRARTRKRALGWARKGGHR